MFIYLNVSNSLQCDATVSVPIAKRLNGKPSFQSSLYFIEVRQNWIEKIWWYATSMAKQGRVTHWQWCVDLAHLDSGPPILYQLLSAGCLCSMNNFLKIILLLL